MAARPVNVDRDTLLLLPPNMRDWVPEGHLVHFILDAVGELDLSRAKINHRGSGSEQYPPSMMLGLLIYSYATGVFGSRQIERSTYENMAAGCGFLSEAAVAAGGDGPTPRVLAPVGREGHGRTVRDLEKRDGPPAARIRPGAQSPILPAPLPNKEQPVWEATTPFDGIPA